MISYHEAVGILKNYAESQDRPTLTLSIEQANGNTIAEDISAPINLPPFDNSGLDGFAIKSGRHTTKRKIVGRIRAGDPPWTRELGDDETVKIMTGAPIPPGAETIVAVEKSTEQNDKVIFSELPPPGYAIRKAGTDFKANEIYIKKGTKLGPKHILALAALGLSEVKVFKALKAFLISTGDEMVPVGKALKPGNIWNSTTPLIKSMACEDQVELGYLGHSSDDRNEFIQLIEAALSKEPDVLISTGAVSMGTEDFVPQILEDLGTEKFFHRVAIRPGRPIWCGYNKKTLVFGLPGNPMSSYVGWRFFIRTYLSALFGTTEKSSRKLRLINDTKKPEHLRCFFKARAKDDGVIILEGQASYMISPLLNSDSFAILPEGKAEFLRGEIVEVCPL